MLEDGFRGVLREVGLSIAPIVIIVLLLQIFLLESSADEIGRFLFAVVLVLLGFTFFLMGVKMGMLPIGEAVGGELPKRGSVLFIVIVVFVLSFLVTIAEPDVRVLSSLISSVSENTISQDFLLLVISISLGFFMIVATIRMLLGIQIKYLFTIGYLSVIGLSFFVPEEFLAISFDSGGVTTGPMTVPIILALGVGLSSVLSKRGQLSESFGLIGLASIGPILGLMIAGVLLQ